MKLFADRVILSGLLAASAIIVGCMPGGKAIKVCPGAESVEQSLEWLKMRGGNERSFKASGQCHLMYYDEGNQKTEKETFPIKIWSAPPHRIYLQGDVAFNARGITAGANEEEFWVAVALKEISGYWWGKWDEQKGLAWSAMSPAALLDAFRGGDMGGQAGSKWLMTKEGPFDVLTGTSSENERQTKIYVYNCNYRISKIVYAGPDGKNEVTVELDKYRKAADEFEVPAEIKIKRIVNGREDSVKIALENIKPLNLSEEQEKRIFTRPQMKGFRNVYKIINGSAVEQVRQEI